MSLANTGGVSRATRATTVGNTSKAKEDQPKSKTESAVTDPDSAIALLVEGDYKSEDDELTLDFLSIIAMQLSQRVKLTAFQASEAFKALSYLILDLHQKRTVGVITDVIAKSVSLATKRVREELEEVTEQLTVATVASTNVTVELGTDCRTVLHELREAVVEAVTALENAGALVVHQQEMIQKREEGARAAIVTDASTYADRVKAKVPAVHATMVAKAELQKRKIRLTKAAGLGGNEMGDLTEKQWVEKANMALELMVGDQHEDEVPDILKPIKTSFVGVSKEREGRGVILEMNSGEAAGWLRGKQVMAAFLAKMGSTVDFQAHTYEVVVDWVPVSFEAQEPAAWKRVEQSNGLRESAIQEAAWIKPTHLRSTGQQTAIAIFRLSSREDANQIIESGLYIEGKKVWGRKQVQEPKRCLKCQCFGEHKAAKCASIHDVCGRCGRQHRTSLCTENGKEKWECSNCKATGNGGFKGHGAADRRCPIFLARVDRMNRVRQENKYRYFCTTDPATWETHEFSSHDKQKETNLHMQEQGGGPRATEAVGDGRRGGRKGAEGGSSKANANTQRQEGGVGVGVNAKAGSSRDKDNGNDQTEVPRNGNNSTVRDGDNRKGDGGGVNRQEGGPRNYRQNAQRASGPSQSQMTLKEMWSTWKGKDRDLRSWSEDIDARMQQIESDRHLNPYPHV